MSERSMSRLVMAALAPLHAVRVENPACPGTPDVNYAGGWLELKEVPSWPADPRWPLRVPHFTLQQRLWMRQRVRHGGRAHLLLKVGAEWLLLRGDVAAERLGEVPPDELRSSAELRWHSREDRSWGAMLCEYLRWKP